MYPPHAVRHLAPQRHALHRLRRRRRNPRPHQTFYSVGGGFILSAAELAPDPQEKSVLLRAKSPTPSAAPPNSSQADANHLTIAELVLANECAMLEAASDPENPL